MSTDIDRLRSQAANPGAVPFAVTDDLFEAFPTASEDMQSRPSGEAPLEFMQMLVHGPIPEEAITFGAYLLPRRKAVWWGHECLRTLTQLLTEQDLRMLQLAERWVREPEEEQRVHALTQATACRSKTPGVWIALAAGWTGGSMVDPPLPKLSPPPYLSPRAVNAGILSGLARVSYTHRASTLTHFVEMGIGIALR